MDIYSNFFSLRSGVYNKITGGKQGGHAMNACGYGIERGQKYWLLQNSWGSAGCPTHRNGVGTIRVGGLMDN